MQRKPANRDLQKKRAKEAEAALQAAAPSREVKRKRGPRGTVVAYSGGSHFDLAELDLSPFKARAEGAGLPETVSRFFAVYMEDRLAGRNTPRAALYRALTGASPDSARSAAASAWGAIVSRGLIPEILEAAGITTDLALGALKEALSGREIIERTAEDGTRDFEVRINPKAQLEASMRSLELLGAYAPKVQVDLSSRTFAELIREATLEARNNPQTEEPAEFQEIDSETGQPKKQDETQ